MLRMICIVLVCLPGLPGVAMASPASPERIQALNEEALQRHGEGDYAQAAVLYQQLLPLLDEYFGADSVEVARITASLADTQAARKQYQEAEQSYRDALAMLDGHDEPLLEADVLNGLASALYMRRRYGAAEPLYLQALARLEGQPRIASSRRLLVLDNLVALYLTLGRSDRAAHYRRQGRALRRELLDGMP